ncbi:hypothetical protein ACEPAH_6545 [Sanghuangporus vaninii]
MPTQRLARGHLPSHSGDFANEMRSWRKLSSGPGIDLKSVADADEDNVKSILTKLRVWLASVLHLTGPTTRQGLRTRPSTRRRNIALLIVCACLLYFYIPSRPKSNSASTSRFEAQEAPRPEPPKRKIRAASHTYRPDGRRLRGMPNYEKRVLLSKRHWKSTSVDITALHQGDLISDGNTYKRTSAGRPIRILKNGMPEAQADSFEEALRDRLNILLDVEDDLPEFRAIISPGDTPNLLKDWELIQEAREAARKGTFIDIDGPPPMKHGWLSACEPHTPAHRRPLDFYGPVPIDLLHKRKKTFIHDHRATMDPCYHPALLFTGGQFLSHYEGPSPHQVLIPQFSSSTTLLHYDLLPIPPSGWGEERHDIPWEHKYDERLLWRGVNTGMMCTPHTRWRQSQRFRLVDMASSVDGDIKVLPPPKEGEENNQVGEGVKWPKVRINPAMMDISFAGSPVQCEEPTCEELKSQFDWRKRMDTSESSRYKYVIDVDGNGWSSRFKRLMASNSLIFKSTVYPEWFVDRIQPWVHYVPIAYDYSDLYDAFIFFRGDITGAGNHDELAKKIALAGSKWASTFWRQEDATAYMFRLLLEYARLISLDRDAMSMNLADYGL